MGFADHIQSIPDSYIVVLKPEINDQAITSHIDSIKSQTGQGSAATLQKPLDIEKFSFHTSGGAHTTALEQTPSTLKGYMGTFSPDVLQMIGKSAEVIWKPFTHPILLFRFSRIFLHLYYIPKL